MRNDQTQLRAKKVFSRKDLNMQGLTGVVRKSFENISPMRELVTKGTSIPLVDCTMSALAMFGIKSSSLLEFDEGRTDGAIVHNLRTLYGVKNVPCDTTMRERLDEIDPKELRPAHKKLFTCIQETKLLREFEYLDGHYIISGDGTGYFSSPTVHCNNCCIKRHGQCVVKFIDGDSDEIDGTKGKNPHYLFFKEPGKPWRLIYRVKNEEDILISLTDIEGLSELIEDKELKKLSGNNKKEIQVLVTTYHEAKHPELAKEYYHQMYCAAIVHPDKKTVIPFAPEPILKSDGNQKNDCERNASKRFFADLRREHPHLKIIVVEDGLASNIPHLGTLQSHNMRFLIGAKPGDHQSLFDSMQQLVDKKSSLCHEHVVTTPDGTIHRFRWLNRIQLNDSDDEFFVNFLQYWQTKPGDKKPLEFSWVTDLDLTQDSVHSIMRAGRARWKIENETFNTLKNQGYNFEHNFGHGKRHLSSVFASLMILAFALDQVCEAADNMFQKVRQKLKQRVRMWRKQRAFFMNYRIKNWHDLYRALLGEHVTADLIFNTA